MGYYLPDGCTQDQIDRLIENEPEDELELLPYWDVDDDAMPPINWQPGLLPVTRCQCGYAECKAHHRMYHCDRRPTVTVTEWNTDTALYGLDNVRPEQVRQEVTYMCWPCARENGLKRDALIVVEEL